MINVIVNKHMRTVTVNDAIFHMPNKMRGNKVKLIGTTLYIDGYQLKDGRWKRTLKALWHRFF